MCSVENQPSTVLTWFINEQAFDKYSFVSTDMYPLNLTHDDQFGGVHIEILEASQAFNTDMASFLSTMKVNISSMIVEGVTSVSCGSFSVRSRKNITLSNIGLFTCASYFTRSCIKMFFFLFKFRQLQPI